MRVLVTGATGFIGRCLVRRLLSRGHKVRALVRGTSNIQDLDAEAEKATGDMTDTESLQKALRGVDMVYNCAGLLGKWGGQGRKALRGECCRSPESSYCLSLQPRAARHPREFGRGHWPRTE